MAGDIDPRAHFSDIWGWTTQEEANRRANEALDAMDVLIDPPGPKVVLPMTAAEFYAKPGRVICVDGPADYTDLPWLGRIATRLPQPDRSEGEVE